MKISFNPSNSNKNILDLIKNNKDIIFDLKGHSIFARGVEFKGTDTNTWRDIKINNVSIGSHTLDLRNGSNTTLTNTNGVVTINSTWRPVVDNLTSDSTTSSLSAKQGKVLKALIDGKSNSDHNHDGIYVRAFRTSNDNIDSDWGQSFKTFDPIPLGTPPEKNPNISLLSIGENFNRRKQLAFIWNNDNIYYRRRIDSGFTNWRRLAFANEIPTSLKNPYALTISLNGTSQGPYDGSAAKNINITPGSIGAAVSNHSHDYLVVNSADDKSFNSAYHNFQVLYAGGGNGITGKPANVDAFGLFKFRAASGWSGQMLLANGGSLYIRSSEDAKMTNTLAWKTILDSSNYSGILDSRYYTESEVNSLLDAKLNRQNLSYGTWNPRGYHLAADYHYNGGDLSISESGGKIHVSVDGYFWQNEGQYRVLDTSDVAGLKSNLTVHQYLSATDAAWYPLVWGGNAHLNTSDSTGAVYKSYDKLSWQTSSQTLYATNIQTNNIKNLSIGGGIYWNPYVEWASDGSDAASITLVKSGVAGGTTLVLSQMNDTNDTIQFKTNTAARLYHNSYPILTTQNTYVSNNKGYINGLEITQVNNADTLDGEHASSFVRAGHYESQDLNKLDTYSFIRSVNSNVSSTSPKGNTGWYNVIQLVHRNGASDGPSYIGQIALGMTTNTNDMFFRGKRTDPWKTVIHSGNIDNQTVANAYHLRINSANTWSTWYWAGQSGQPSWLWGSNDGTNMYVWDPSNFRVAYASSAGNADTVDGYHAASFVKMYTGKFNQYNEGTWTKILQFTIPSGDLQPTISFIWHPTECARGVWADFNINIRSGSPIFYVNWKGTTRRTVYCVGDGTTYSVWVQGTKSQYDPFGLVQVISTWQINTYQAGSLQYSDSEPTGTYKVVASMSGIIMYADRLLTARKINGTSFDGTSDITTAYWGTTRTISLTGAITGSVSTNGGGNITINTTYGTGNITNLDNRYVKKAGDTMQGNLTFTSGKQTRWTAHGTSYITDGNVDSGTSLGGDLANLVISSWYGVSFTTSCSGQTYTNKTAVGINCRTGQLYAREVQANGFMHTGHNNNDAVLLAGGGYKTLKDFIFLNKSYNYTDHEHYNLTFHKLSGICNNLVWVDGHVKGSIAKFFVIDPAVFPYRYDEDPNLNTIYLMSGNNYITINAIGIVTINNATDHEQRVGFFYTGRA